jgi:DNA-binding IclR family transcriptional regulator
MQWLHLNLGEYTRSELAKRTGIRLSSICGRVSELIALGYLEEAGRRRCTETGRSAHPVRISLPKQPQQLDLLGATA